MGNTLSSYILSSSFMIVMLVILSVRGKLAIREKSSRISCFALIMATALYVIFDALFITCHLLSSNGTPNMLGKWKVIAFFFTVVYIALPYVWHLFVRSYVGTDYGREVLIIETIPMIVLLGCLIATPFNNMLYTFEEGFYNRGWGYTFYNYFNYFYYVEPLLDLVIIMCRKREQSEHYIAQAIFISLVPLVGAVVNSVLPQGTIFPFQPFISVVVAMLGVFFIAMKDSDALKDHQQQVIADALDKAEEASNVKTKFLSDMSHDIRTPMNAIISLTDLALKETDPEVIRGYLEKIKISNKFLLGLINDVLDMSKIESGDLVLHKEGLSRAEFLDTVNTIVAPLMESKHINYHPELKPGGYIISVDKLRFNQIFFNLLSNAVKYTPEGGDVWFEVYNELEENNRLKVRFVVRDNGVGMSEEFQKHLFEPFAREQSEYNLKVQGTGLGLSIVKGLVDKMGGTIEVKSELGKGTEFDVSFSVDILTSAEGGQIAEIKQDNEDYDLSGLRVLLVEDNELNTYIARTILEKVGCIVTEADNGETAVKTFAESAPNTFDVILMDIRMPVMNGIDATKAIRKLDRDDAVAVPIVAMTADVFEDERKTVFDAGITHFLSKPFIASELYAVLKECSATPPRTTK